MRRLSLAGALLLASCAREPPAARDAIVFVHGPHLKAGVQCTKCHALSPDAAARGEGGNAGGAAQRPGLPSEAQCRACHEGPEQGACRYCHSHPEAAATYADREHHIHFDHAARVPQHRDECVRCHGLGQSDKSVLAFEPSVPPMRRCTESCHAQDMPALRCGLCHSDLHRYERREIELIRHPPGFLHRHGAQARLDDALCGQCHEPTFCSDCHTASPNLPLDVLKGSAMGREFIHAADFRARHASEARVDQATCLRCHGVDFCDGCHRDTGIGGGVGRGSPHPPGWLDPLSPRGHAREARRDILTCAGCHDSDAERTCVPCHRVGSIAGNPHPPGFGSGFDRDEQGVCRVCHAGQR